MLILHHYPMSPFSEKIRLMLGYSDASWQSLPSPEMPPRPNIDPLCGGYRRIPIAQSGADIFCDSRLISAEIARTADKPSLDPGSSDAAARDYAAHLEGEVFWAAVLSIGTGVTIKQLLRNMGLWKTLRFIKDRAGVGKSARVALPSTKQAKMAFADHLRELDQHLQAVFLDGDKPSYLDFAAYHTLWFQRVVGQLPMPVAVPRVAAWYQSMADFGHGKVTEISREKAFAAARDNTPRKVPVSDSADKLIGSRVTISPDDYALTPVQGTLVGSSVERWIVARDTTKFGLLHVHLPRSGFELR